MNSFDSDAFDHKGNLADRTKTGGWLSAVQILGTFHSIVTMRRKDLNTKCLH